MSGLEDALQRDEYLLFIREHGPLAFRMILQPLVATAIAIRAGLRDARSGRRPFAVLVATEPALRRTLLRELWGDIGRLYLLAVIIDVIFQYVVSRSVDLVQALAIAAILAFPAYLVARGLTNRIARRRVAPGAGGTP